MSTTQAVPAAGRRHRVGSNVPFFACFAAIAASYVILILAMLVADTGFTSLADFPRVWFHDGVSGLASNFFPAIWASLEDFRDAWANPKIRFATWLTLASCTLTALVSLIVAIPAGFLMSRFEFRGKNLVDAILDIPIVLPPLVIGVSLLILFRTSVGTAVDSAFVWLVNNLGVNNLLVALGARTIRGIYLDMPAVFLAQFSVACAFAVRTMRAAFDQIDVRQERVALTLGCRHSQAFYRVVLPQAWPGVMTAGTLAWARAMGEFGPLLVFAGTTDYKSVVLSTAIFLELSIGSLESAVAISLLMIVISVVVLMAARHFGLRKAVL